MLSQNAQAPQLGKSPVKQIVAAMTLEEKASLVVGKGGGMMMGPPAAGAAGAARGGAAPAPEQAGAARGGAAPASAQAGAARGGAAPGGPMIGQTQALVPGAAGTTYDLPRLGITPMVLADGPAGLRISPTRQGENNTYYATAFPVGTLLASTWDVELVNKVGQAMGNEVLEYGVDVLLGPGVNLHRNPLCGRNFEYYSEDPFVIGKIAAAMINGVESQGVGTSIKHYAANNAETNRNSLNTIVSERTLREIYLEGFRIAIQEAQPWTVMSSYNLINGTWAPESYDLITNILRKDWDFKGFVMTDWGGGRDWPAEVRAGNDLIMPGNPSQAQAIVAAVKEGKLSEKDLDRNVESILSVMLASPRFKGYKYSNKPDLKTHAQVTRQAATEGMVLLKNSEAALPFADTVKKVAAFGNTSYDIITGGTGSGDVNEAYSVSLVEGLKNVGYAVNENVMAMYQAYLKAAKEGQPAGRQRSMMGGSTPIAELGVSSSLATSMATASDAAIITIGRNSGEGRDRQNIEGDFKLSAAEKDMLKAVADAFHANKKKVVVILNVGGVVETASWKDIPDAILLAWQGGQETGNSIADILNGKVNPSGKLATTFPVNYEDNPSSKTFPGKELPADPSAQAQQGAMRGRPAEVVYEDGIYVGYRYYETFKIKPSYEFGYGLSFTNFEYSNLKLSSTQFGDSLTITVDVKNAGKAAGKEAAQLYLSAPAGKLDKPAMELKAFAKTRLLQPGESQTLGFVINSRSLASFDPEASSWIADAGTYTVRVGASSKDIRQSATFTLGKPLTVKKETASLIPKVKINELKPAK
jgi:beta-glucosidase